MKDIISADNAPALQELSRSEALFNGSEDRLSKSWLRSNIENA